MNFVSPSFLSAFDGVLMEDCDCDCDSDDDNDDDDTSNNNNKIGGRAEKGERREREKKGLVG